MAGMNPMSRKNPPAEPTFRLLGELNEWISLSKKEREAILTEYAEAGSQRSAALVEIAETIAEAEADHEAADRLIVIARTTARQEAAAAETKAKEIVEAALSQAQSVTETARKTVGEAADKVKAADAEARDRLFGISDREDACALREAEVEAQQVAVRNDERATILLRDQYETLIGNKQSYTLPVNRPIEMSVSG